MSFLELNCAQCPEVPMRGFRRKQHGLVLFDEISPKQVADQRKLFQASHGLVQMGCSATNIHAYEVYMHAVRLVCCSNKWQADLDTLRHADAEWIVANCVYVQVKTPLFADATGAFE